MSSPNPTIYLSGLARRLIQDKLLDQQQAEDAHQKSAAEKLSLVRYLVKNNIVSAMSLAISASHEYGLPVLDLDALDKDTLETELIAEKLIRAHHVLPLYKRGKRLYIGVSDPTNLQALDEIKFHTGLATSLVIVEDDKLTNSIDTALASQTQSMSDMLSDDLENLEIVDDDNEQDDSVEAAIDDAPIVKYVNKILLDAINQNVSDIHFEPFEKVFRIRYRQDGVLHEAATAPKNQADKLSARIKVMARMNIAERRVPQDGRIKLNLSKNHSVDFRVNTCPTLYGEKIVMRILDAAGAQLGLDALGFDETQKKHFVDAIHKPYGMVLVTGPTGSGKTVSLYTALNMLNDPEINISTAEDPVEIQVTGINQVNVNVRQGLTFPVVLRAFLRQDPDILMVGEIRDLETAEISVKAAQTGHLVLSTLHTNDAPQTLTRLANMGVPPYNIASSVLLIMAQRLARRLCEHCKVIDKEIPKEALIEEGFTEQEANEGITVYKPAGCDKCSKGYKGRVGIFQIMPISEEMGRLIMEGKNALDLEQQSVKEGITNLRRSGLNKVKEGVTSLEEINRVTKD